jgi:hypothetical protein
MTAGPHIYTSGHPDVLVPDRSLPDFLLDGVSERLDRPALVDGPTGHALTYRELADGVRRVAAGLAAHGLGRATCSPCWRRTHRSGCSAATGRWPPAAS